MKRSLALSLFIVGTSGLFSSSLQARTTFLDHYLFKNEGGKVVEVYKVNPDEVACTRKLGNNVCWTNETYGLGLEKYPAGFSTFAEKKYIQKLIKIWCL